MREFPFEGAETKSDHDAQLTCYVKRDFYYDLSRISEKEFNQKRAKTYGNHHVKNYWFVGNFPIDERMLHYFLVYVGI